MGELYWAGNLSFSALNLFKKCERHFFYQKIMDIPSHTPVETKWSRFGIAVHSAIETGEEMKDLWRKYELFETDLSFDSAKKQVDYGRNLNFDFLKKEHLIEFKIKNINFKCFIDGILSDGSILDWKTSTFTNQKVVDYREQLLFYSWCIFKKYDYIPKKSSIVFLKSKKIITFNFSEKNIFEYEKYIFNEIKKFNLKKNLFENFVPNRRSCFFCGYKLKCSSEKTRKIKIEITHKRVRIVTSMPNKFNSMASEKLSYEIDNKFFVLKQLAKRGQRNFDGIIRLYKNQTTSLGFRKKLIELLGDVIIEENDVRVFSNTKIETMKKLQNVELRPYQERAVEQIIKDKINFSEICTGAGKTIIAGEIIRRLEFKTIFVVDRNVILKQAINFLKKFGFKNIGTVVGGKQNWSDITVASIQTLANVVDEEGLKQIHDCNVVIVDEAHISKSKSYQKFFSKIRAEYRIGLSGTAYSDGNNSLELYKTFGFPDFQIKSIDLIRDGFLVMPKIEFLEYSCDSVVYGEYQVVYSKILMSSKRSGLVRDVVKKHIEDNVLVMVDRLEHVELFSRVLEDGILIITGSTPKNERENILNHIRSSSGNVLVATSGVIQKGVDIPNLDVLVNYSANLGSIKTIQCLGRTLRKSEGKTESFYYDFEDTHSALIDHTIERKRTLRGQGYDVK